MDRNCQDPLRREHLLRQLLHLLERDRANRIGPTGLRAEAQPVALRHRQPPSHQPIVLLVQDVQRAYQPEYHVNSKPVLRRPENVQQPNSLAQGIDEQRQHHDAADDAEPVADAFFRVDELLRAQQIACDNEQREQQIAARSAARAFSRNDDGRARRGHAYGSLQNGFIHRTSSRLFRRLASVSQVSLSFASNSISLMPSATARA